MRPDPRPGSARRWIEACLGRTVSSLAPLEGGAGARRYTRVHLADRSSAIWMQAHPERPEIVPPALRGCDPVGSFVSVSALLAGHGLPVPEIHAVHEREPWILLEDLGDLHLLDLPPGERLDRQAEAVEILSRVHGIPRSDALPFSRQFDEEWIHFELEHVLRYGVGPDLREPLREGFGELARRIAALPRTLCLRDCHSRNLMIDERGRLRLIDYQDALLAPPELDLAALLEDSYVSLSGPDRARLVRCYGELRGETPDAGALALLIVQRKCKDFARFRYLAQRGEELGYRSFAEAAGGAVLRALPDLPEGFASLCRLLERALEGAGK